MIVKNDYNNCLTNLACSIQKYFGLNPKHKTLKYVDDLLDEKKPKNVVCILFDGMGSRILDRTLTPNSFLIKNKYTEITSVFPATTTAATTSIRTGLNPIEHGWLAWNTYISPIDKVITLFKNSEKGKADTICEEFLKVKNKLVSKSIIDEINEKTNFTATEISPFSENKYNNIDEMFAMIEEKCNSTDKKYIYAYDTEPDHSMHDYGPDDDKVKELIKIRNDKVESLCNKLKDTILFVIADHGHILVNHVFLKDYPKITETFERTTSLEQRAVSFKIKDNCKEKFIEEFNKNFGNDFKLYSKQEIIDSHLFGDGDEHELFEDALGDFIAIAENSNKCLITDGDEVLASQHAGYSDDEIYVPLIIIDKTWNCYMSDKKMEVNDEKIILCYKE